MNMDQSLFPQFLIKITTTLDIEIRLTIDQVRNRIEYHCKCPILLFLWTQTKNWFASMMRNSVQKQKWQTNPPFFIVLHQLRARQLVYDISFLIDKGEYEHWSCVYPIWCLMLSATISSINFRYFAKKNLNCLREAVQTGSLRLIRNYLWRQWISSRHAHGYQPERFLLRECWTKAQWCSQWWSRINAVLKWRSGTCFNIL